MTDNNDSNSDHEPKRRSLTSLTLGWLAERMRKVDKIKEKLQSGAYQVEADKVAESIINTK